MGDSANSSIPKDISVSYWRKRRLVIFDPSFQPDNSEFMLLYFVEGHELCARHRAVEQGELTAVANQYDREDALAQYRKWLSVNAAIAADKKSHSDFEIDEPPPGKKTCPDCNGQGTWFDTSPKGTYGVAPEGSNIIERCPTCRGALVVSDLL